MKAVLHLYLCDKEKDITIRGIRKLVELQNECLAVTDSCVEN
jgi:hypothetical protein